MNEVPTVREMMVKVTASVSPDSPVYEALDTLVAKKLAGIPVIDAQGRLAGFLTEKDCLRLQGNSHQYNMTGCHVRDIMSEIKQKLHPEMDLLTAITQFLSCNFATLPVLEGDKLVGSITRHNVLKTIQAMHKERGQHIREDKKAIQIVVNPSSIDELQTLVGRSSKAQLASVFGGRHSPKKD